jgi:predicted type IV restriction endonuclease
MDFIDRLRELSNQIPKLEQQGLIKTEEGTKNALIMPFINALGYNVFDPTEVTPELVADVGTKKGEKVDYAILRDGKPIILFECKSFKTNLGDAHASQLFRYFTVTAARFAILTNGIVYHFYTDLEESNKMDKAPFLVIDMTDLKEPLVEELKKFTKSAFDVDKIISTASELKYLNAVKEVIKVQLTTPSEDFVRFFASQVYVGVLRQSVLQQFGEITKRAWKETIADRMKETFTKAAEGIDTNTNGSSAGDKVPDKTADQASGTDTKVETTHDELEGYNIVRAIIREILEIKRIAMRDGQSYFSVLLDDNNRKPICRLYLNGGKKYIGLFDAQKVEEKVSIQTVDDIFQHAERIKATVTNYESAGKVEESK